MSSPLVLGVNRQSHPAHHGGYGETPFASAQQELASQPLALGRLIDREAREPKHRHLILAQTLAHDLGYLGELDRPWAQCVTTKDPLGIAAGDGDKGFRSSALVILPGIALEVFVKLEDTAVKGSALMLTRDRLLAPVVAQHQRARRARAALRSFSVGLG